MSNALCRIAAAGLVVGWIGLVGALTQDFTSFPWYGQAVLVGAVTFLSVCVLGMALSLWDVDR